MPRSAAVTSSSPRSAPTVLEAHADPRELTAISDALDELATIDPPLAEIVDLKFFCGLSFAEIAAMRGLSERTVQRKWEKARIYLHGPHSRAGLSRR
jgi:DNA-directed RNA polymerase specialized sigma24 family protein